MQGSGQDAPAYYGEALKRLDSHGTDSVYHGASRARILHRLGRTEAAESVFLSLIEANPGNLDLKNDYAEMLIDWKKYDEALEILEPIR